MISYIKGALGAVEDDVIVVETGGIGLAVHVTPFTFRGTSGIRGRSDRFIRISRCGKML